MEKGIAEFIRLFDAEKDFIVQNATKSVGRLLVREAPVDTGEFVADWDVDVNHWPSDTQQPNDPSRRLTRRRLDAVIERLKFGDAVFYENNDPVAVRLEFGFSQQVPRGRGMVRYAARRWRGFVRGAGRAAQNRVKKRLAGD